jgi:selenocysteine lyase/cysteine desulfurase
MDAEIRKLFPVAQNYVYLNHAAVAPLSLPVIEAVQQHERDLLENGFVNWRTWDEEVERIRALAARFINAQSQQMAFVANTSTGLAMIANGIDWQAGDNVVSAECEFPSNVQPWVRLQRELGVEVKRAPERNGRLHSEEILSLVDERTRVVTLSFVEFASGFRNDLQTLGRYCRERDVLFVVDAIQGLGALQLDVERDFVDALSADAHKFLLGPNGIGILYLSERAMQRVKPTLTGWMSVRNPWDMTNRDQDYAKGAKRFEPGALNLAGVVALGATMQMMLDVGQQTIESYLLELTDYLCERLQQHNYRIVSSRLPGEASAIVCCQHDQHSAEHLYQLLETKRIITTARMGRLRISPHFYNTREEVDHLMAALPA